MTEYTNPVVPGFAPDPSVILVDGVFYLATSSFHLYPGIPIYASRDLHKWHHITNAIHRPEQLSLRNGSTFSMPLHGGGKMLACGGLFAPTIRHHEGRFFIICTNATTNPVFRVQNFYIWTDDIWDGLWSNPVEFPFKGIDPSLFFEDGRAYVQGSFSLGMDQNPSCTIKQFEINIETGQPMSEPVEIWPGHSKIDTEGPHIYKRDGWYYLLVAEGGTFQHHMLSIARARSIWGPYEGFEKNPIMTSDGKPGEYIQNIGHGELVEDAAGRWWATVLGVRKRHDCHPLGRETFLAPVEWPVDGWPSISQPAATFTAPDKRFDKRVASVNADVGFVYIRDSEPSNYQMPHGESKQIVLRPSLGDLSQSTGTATFVGRRQRALSAVTKATLDLAGSGGRDTDIIAGLAIYKHNLHHVLLRYDFKTRTVTFRGVNQVTGLSKEAGPSFVVGDSVGALQFKIETSDAEYHGFVSVDGPFEKGWQSLGTWQTSDFTANEMTGPVFGVFAHSSSEDDLSSEVVFMDTIF
ncbi:hypothetical protein CC79DRAFT_1388281 [Sarocladium strictum]